MNKTENEGTGDKGNKGAREQGSQGTREQGNEGTRDYEMNGLRDWDSVAVGGEAADDFVVFDVLAGEHHRVRGDMGARADGRGNEADLLKVGSLMGMREDAREGADDGVVADGDAAAIVQESALVDGDAISDGEVVAVGKVDAVVDFDPCANMREDMPPQHAAEAKSEPVIETDG